MKLFLNHSLSGLLIFIAAVFSLPTSAATVHVSYFGLSLDPVNIKAGDAVYWDYDDVNDDLGPYFVTGGWGTIMTPAGIQFNVPPGAYAYSVQSAFGGGSWNGTVNVSADLPPVVAITNPTNNSVFTAPATFAFEADATATNQNDLEDVEFWIGDTMVDDVLAPPYSTTVTNLAAGTYTLKAIAWAYFNVSATNSISITVVNPGPITLTGGGLAGGNFVFSANGLAVGKTNVLEGSTNLVAWFPLRTNPPGAISLNFTNPAASQRLFFRIRQIQ